MRRNSILDLFFEGFMSNNNNYSSYNAYNDIKERPASYQLKSFEFDTETRIAKIAFLEIKEFRTIERYVTRNYVKHPIYSAWKTKTKVINKTIKLSNKELESLNKHDDFLIKKYAYEIITKINDPNLFPSWFILECLKKEYSEEVAGINKSFSKFEYEKQRQIQNIVEEINYNQGIILHKQSEYQIWAKKEHRINTKISKINKAKPSIFLSIITVGIYGYYTSKKRKETLYTEARTLKSKIDFILNEISQIQKDNSNLHFKRNALQEQIDSKKRETDQLLSKTKSIYESRVKINQAKPLSTSYDFDDSFILLKNLGGLEYKTIIGCYIIHNREKDKYYVGQSKDVLRRLKQHFKGTVPNNIIFAEDYYSSTYSHKEDIFEVKIIPCKTKDELDKTEKNLIEKYDAWISGYNGTSGNN